MRCHVNKYSLIRPCSSQSLQLTSSAWNKKKKPRVFPVNLLLVYYIEHRALAPGRRWDDQLSSSGTSTALHLLYMQQSYEKWREAVAGKLLRFCASRYANKLAAPCIQSVLQAQTVDVQFPDFARSASICDASIARSAST